MSERINLVIEDGIGDLLTELAGSERKRGEWLSKMVRAMHDQRQQIEATDTETMKLTILGMAGQIKGIDARLMKVEQNLAAVIAKSS